MNMDVGSALKGVSEIADQFITDDTERAQAKRVLMDAENKLVSDITKYEATLVETQGSIVLAEAKSDSWLVKNWRPLLMLSITAILIHKYILYPYLSWLIGPEVPVLDLPPELFTLLTVGVGGYVVGRSGEKIANTIRSTESVNTVTKGDRKADRKDQRLKGRQMKILMRNAKKNNWSEEMIERQMELLFDDED